MIVLDPATEAAIGRLSATIAVVDQGLVSPAVVRNVAHALADVARHALLDDLAAQLDLIDGPTVEELEEIEAEVDVLDAELAVVDAEIEFAAWPSIKARRHLRRTQHALARALAVHANHPSTEGELP